MEDQKLERLQMRHDIAWEVLRLVAAPWAGRDTDAVLHWGRAGTGLHSCPATQSTTVPTRLLEAQTC